MKLSIKFLTLFIPLTISHHSYGQLSELSESISSGNYPKTISILNELIDNKNTQDYQAYYYARAECYLHLKNYEMALNDINSAIRFNGKNIDYHITKSEIYSKQNQFETALEYLNGLTFKNPAIEFQKSKIYFQIYLDLNKKDALDQAEKTINILIADSSCADFYLHRANIYESKKNIAKSVNDYIQASILEPNDSYIYCRKGNMLMRQKEYGQAIKSFNEGLKINPQDNIILYRRALCKFDFKDYQGTVDDLKSKF